jgi:DNA-binding GntR family transcriptional regulator
MAATGVAYETIKRRVLDGDLAGGDFVSEGRLAEDLAMSRTPVREALLRLEVEGLVRLYPKRGALVLPVTAADVEAVMETRLLVEGHCAERAVARGVDLAGPLRASLARQDEHLAAGDLRAFAEEDRRFHHLVVEAAANPILSALYGSLRDRQVRMGRSTAAEGAERRRRIRAEHRRLAEALAAGDAGAAREATRAHLEGTREGLHRLLGRGPIAG